MGTKADFYVMDHDGSMEWLGSITHDGHYVQIPAEIFIAGNKIMFEENVENFINSQEQHGILKSIDKGWPWLWADSRMTDYSYIFHVCTGKVLVCSGGGRAMDAIKLVQGMDEIGADVGMGLLKFPVMNKDMLVPQAEAMEAYGSESTETV